MSTDPSKEFEIKIDMKTYDSHDQAVIEDGLLYMCRYTFSFEPPIIGNDSIGQAYPLLKTLSDYTGGN